MDYVQLKYSTAMKTSLKSVSAIVAVVIAGVVLVKWPLIHAQTVDSQQGPVSVVVNNMPKQYRVIDISKIPTGYNVTLPQTLENGLNEMGSQGWQLVAATGNLLIMMR